MKKNYIAIVLDVSGSMGPYKHQVIDILNETIKSIKNNKDQENYISLLTFNTSINELFSCVPSELTKFINYYDIHTSGGTALLDGMVKAIQNLKKDSDYKDADASFLVIGLTDGDENSSIIDPRGVHLKELIKDCEKDGRWTITFQVPKGNSDYLTKFGLSRNNIREWEQTTTGLQETHQSLAAGMTNYFNVRSKGTRSLSTFYTDASQISKTTLKKDLINVSDQFENYVTSKEEVIRQFVERKTKRPYHLGIAFYQLMKNEKVQSNKEILIQDKTTKAIYGGNEARELIGLPVGQDAKVIPGNHANYEIYVQSTSVNRILPRGTKVLVRK